MASLETDSPIAFKCDPACQVYYLENLREANRRYLFQVRFPTHAGARELSSCFLSLEDASHVHQLSLQFPARGDRGVSSRILGWLKEAWHRERTDIEFEIAGFGERSHYRYICEHSLSSFQWNETLQRYLHVTDHFQEIKEVRGGKLSPRNGGDNEPL